MLVKQKTPLYLQLCKSTSHSLYFVLVIFFNVDSSFTFCETPFEASLARYQSALRCGILFNYTVAVRCLHLRRFTA